MDNEKQLDPIEASLRELGLAEEAGLFQPTRVDAGRCVRVSREEVARGRRTARLWLSAVAATIVLALGVWTWLFSVEISAVRDRAMLAGREAVTSPADCRDRSILACVTGPSQLALAGCAAHDYDTDGDVDMADFRTYQLACADNMR